jgi:hypothetical protein
MELEVLAELADEALRTLGLRGSLIDEQSRDLRHALEPRVAAASQRELQRR